MKPFSRFKNFFHYFSKHATEDKAKEKSSPAFEKSKSNKIDAEEGSSFKNNGKRKNRVEKKPASKEKSEGPGKKSNIKPEPENKDLLFEEMINKSMKKSPVSEFKQSSETLKPIHQVASEYPPPQKSLDLHGMTQDAAVKKIRCFVSSCRKEGKLTVRVITGRGKHSPAGPVLKEVAEKEAVMLKNENQLIFFKWDRKKKHKSSSMLFFLRQKKK
ncbi:MAG: Smr/MutS family protein [bacterium]